MTRFFMDCILRDFMGPFKRCAGRSGCGAAICCSLYSGDDTAFSMGVCTAPPLGFQICRQGRISSGLGVAHIA